MQRRHRRLLALSVGLAVSATLASASTAGASTRPGTAAIAKAAAQARVLDPAAYAAAKAAADADAARIAGRAGRPGPSPLAPAAATPAITRNWDGLLDRGWDPSDSTGAIGTTRYIELVNSKAAVYTRTSDTPAASGTLTQLTGCPASVCYVVDPQVIWDPDTNRFYYAALNITQHAYFLDFGFSTTATPTLSGPSWCRYHLSWGLNIPDYPKLGDTSDFMLIGTNEFNNVGSYIGARIAWARKPPSGTGCPAISRLTPGISGVLRNANGAPAFTPVPANQTDSSPTGWAVAIPASEAAGGTGTYLTLFRITRAANGSASITTTGASVAVPAYRLPANARQGGSAYMLDTLDGRNTQAVSAIDPDHRGVTALWTQHTVFGGAGAQVRWYEINPATRGVIQRGTITSTSRYTYNGAISPDRRVNGRSRRFGGNMVINVNQSSATMRPAVEVASKIGAYPVSALRLVATSGAPDIGFTCVDDGACRWGDYASATPDPASPVFGRVGQVWGSSMLSAGGNIAAAGWRTRDFAIRP